jgi:type I restriction enzyme S subunit
VTALSEFISTRTPPGWQTKPLWSLFRRQKITGHPDEELLSVYRDYGVIPRSSRDDNFNVASEDLSGYQLVTAGCLVTNKMKAWQGSIAISRHQGIVSPAYYVYRPLSSEDDQFLHYLLRSEPYIALYGRISKGVRVNQWDLEHEALRNIPVMLPDPETQKGIADFLDRETARIDQLIEKKRSFLAQIAHRIEALVDKAISDPETPRIRFEYATQSVRRPAVLSEHDELVRLGLYNRGRGIFKKPAADEEGMGDSDFFFVEEGDLILSGQFAWEGAVAVATEEEEGCVVSHRYPVYRGRQGVRAAYLVGLLRSRFGDFLLNEASRGAAGRNRPLNVRRLGKEKIPLPADELQLEVEQAIFGERRLKAKTAESISVLEELRSALITAAVTGQIDTATRLPSGRAQQILDNVEAEPLPKEARG